MNHVEFGLFVDVFAVNPFFEFFKQPGNQYQDDGDGNGNQVIITANQDADAAVGPDECGCSYTADFLV